jgi:hypothetical protein
LWGRSLPVSSQDSPWTGLNPLSTPSLSLRKQLKR